MSQPTDAPSFSHTFSGGSCIHCQAGWGSPAHLESLTECPELHRVMQALRPDPDEAAPLAAARTQDDEVP